MVSPSLQRTAPTEFLITDDEDIVLVIFMEGWVGGSPLAFLENHWWWVFTPYTANLL